MAKSLADDQSIAGHAQPTAAWTKHCSLFVTGACEESYPDFIACRTRRPSVFGIGGSVHSVCAVALSGLYLLTIDVAENPSLSCLIDVQPLRYNSARYSCLSRVRSRVCYTTAGHYIHPGEHPRPRGLTHHTAGELGGGEVAGKRRAAGPTAGERPRVVSAKRHRQRTSLFSGRREGERSARASSLISAEEEREQNDWYPFMLSVWSGTLSCGSARPRAASVRRSFWSPECLFRYPCRLPLCRRTAIFLLTAVFKFCSNSTRKATARGSTCRLKTARAMQLLILLLPPSRVRTSRTLW